MLMVLIFTSDLGLRSGKNITGLTLLLFFEKFMRPDQELQNVYYCTAVQTNTGKKDRQDLFFSANKVNPKFNLIFGKFLQKQVTYGGNTYTTYEEKQTDVNIAVQLIRNVVLDKCDVSIIVSADSDLVPPIEFIRELNPNHKIFCYFPPKRYSTDLKFRSDAIQNLEKYEHRFKTSMLPDKVTLPNGFVAEIPIEWKV